MELHIVQKETETDDLLTLFHTKTEIDTSLNNKLNASNPEMTGVLKSNDIDSKTSLSNLQLKHNSAIYLGYDYDFETNGGLVLGKPFVIASTLDIPLNIKLYQLYQHTDSYINETLNYVFFCNVLNEPTGEMKFDVGDPATASNLV